MILTWRDNLLKLRKIEEIQPGLPSEAVSLNEDRFPGNFVA